MSKSLTLKTKQQLKTSAISWVAKDIFGNGVKTYILNARECKKLGIPVKFTKRFNHVHKIKGRDQNKKKVDCLILSTYTDSEHDRDLLNVKSLDSILDEDIEGNAMPCNYAFALSEDEDGELTCHIVPVIKLYEDLENEDEHIEYVTFNTAAGDGIGVDHEYEGFTKYPYKRKTKKKKQFKRG